MSHMKTFALPFFIAVFVCAVPLFAAAQVSELRVTPVVIDKKAKARDILKETITITNTSNRRLNLYPSVHNVDATDGEKPFEAATNAEDRADSLANWIELSRGVIELGPGEEKAIPFTIRVNLNAVADTYHAQVGFFEGSTREKAEEKGALASVMVNVEVQADIKEVLQLNAFTTDNVFFSGDDVLFNYQLENIGNQALEPTGEIRIYDRKGREVTSLEINSNSKTVSPEQVAQLASVWSAVDGFGKYKAFLTVNYGKTQTASVQDTIFFWIVPWKQLLALFVGTLVAVILLSLYFHRLFERRHMRALALAGHPTVAHAEAAQEMETNESEHTELEPEPQEKKRRFAFFSKGVSALASVGARMKKKPAVVAAAPSISQHEMPVVAAEPVTHAQSTPVTTAPAKRSLREAFGDMPARQKASAPHSDVIDLKAMRSGAHSTAAAPTQTWHNTPQATVQPSHGHVIDLKKRK